MLDADLRLKTQDSRPKTSDRKRRMENRKSGYQKIRVKGIRKTGYQVKEQGRGELETATSEEQRKPGGFGLFKVNSVKEYKILTNDGAHQMGT